MWPKIVDYDNNKHTCLGVNKKDTWHAIGLRWLTSMYRCITNCKLWSFICENSEECANFFQTFVLVCCIQFKTETTVCTPHPADAVIEYVQISLFHKSHVTHSKHTNNRIKNFNNRSSLRIGFEFSTGRSVSGVLGSALCQARECLDWYVVKIAPLLNVRHANTIQLLGKQLCWKQQRAWKF